MSVDEIISYLSTKFNKIFCDREFVCCVNEDFQILLKNKNKCCVLVFPVLGPIYLKAVRYQAKIFDLAVIQLASGRFKSVAVCNKRFLKKSSGGGAEEEEAAKEDYRKSERYKKSITSSDNQFPKDLTEEQDLSKEEDEMVHKKKRPEREIYMTPAQRKRMLEQRSLDRAEKRKELQIQKEQEEQDEKTSELTRKEAAYRAKYMPLFVLPRNLYRRNPYINKKPKIPVKLLNIANSQCVPIFSTDSAGYLSVYVNNIVKIMDFGRFIDRGDIEGYPVRTFSEVLECRYETRFRYILIEDYQVIKDLIKYCNDTFDKKYRSLMVVRTDLISPVQPYDILVDLDFINKGHLQFIFQNSYTIDVSYCRLDHSIIECYCERKFPNLMINRIKRNAPSHDLKGKQRNRNPNHCKKGTVTIIMEQQPYNLTDVMKHVLKLMHCGSKMHRRMKRIYEYSQIRQREVTHKTYSRKDRNKRNARQKKIQAKKSDDEENKEEERLTITEQMQLYLQYLDEMKNQCLEVMTMKSLHQAFRLTDYQTVKDHYCYFLIYTLERIERLHRMRGFHYILAPFDLSELESVTEEEWTDFVNRVDVTDLEDTFDNTDEIDDMEEEFFYSVEALQYPPNPREVELNRQQRKNLYEKALKGEVNYDDLSLFAELEPEDRKCVEELIKAIKRNPLVDTESDTWLERNRRLERDLDKLPTLTMPEKFMNLTRNLPKPVTKADKKNEKKLSDYLPVLLDDTKRVPEITNVEEYLNPKVENLDIKGAKPKSTSSKSNIDAKLALRHSKCAIKSMLFERDSSLSLLSNKACSVVDAVRKPSKVENKQSKSTKKAAKATENGTSASKASTSADDFAKPIIPSMPKFKMTKVEERSAGKAICEGEAVASKATQVEKQSGKTKPMKKSNSKELKLPPAPTEQKPIPKPNPEPEKVAAPKSKPAPKPQPKLSDFVDIDTLKSCPPIANQKIKKNSNPEPEAKILTKSVEISEPLPENKIKTEDEEEKEIMRKTKENINRKTKPIMKYVEDDNILKINKAEDLNNWEDLFDDEGHLAEELFSEIANKFDDQYQPQIVKAAEDYSAYTTKKKSLEEINHIVEVYDFPAPLCTNDILQAFSHLKSDAMYVKWVDDTHALLVLESFDQALRAVNDSPLIKTRPMVLASPQALAVAYNNDLKPAMKRPPTDVQTARRMIASHLRAAGKLAKEIKETTAQSMTNNSQNLQGKEIEKFEHVIELYNISSTFTTADIMQTFSYMSSDSMYVKWVDTNRALLVLGSSIQAKRVLENQSPIIKARPMTEASPLSLAVARDTDLKPAMKRPQTNLQTARRMITTHLGATSKVTREQSNKERNDLRAARELKKKAKQDEKDAWEGNLRSSINQ